MYKANECLGFAPRSKTSERRRTNAHSTFFSKPGHGDEDHKILNKIMIQRPRQSSIPFFDDVGWEMLIDQFDDPPNLNDDKRV